MTNIKIKICGITNLPDARAAVEAGTDFLGFIFHPPSPRRIDVENARVITDILRADYGNRAPVMVGVFVNETVAAVTDKMALAGLNLAQLSGDESPQMVKALYGSAYKAIRPRSLEEAAADVRDYAPLGTKKPEYPAIVVDSFHPDLRGGTGEVADFGIMQKICQMESRVMLAGGLTPDNIAGIVTALRPFAVDVASGVEASKGKKDHDKVRDFITRARAAAEMDAVT